MRISIYKICCFIIFLFFSISSFAKSGNITQYYNSHPFAKINDWNVNGEDLTIDEVISENAFNWEKINLNEHKLIDNNVAWYKTDFIVPKYLENYDLIIEVNATPETIVYVDGKQLFTANEFPKKGVLTLSSEFNEKYSIQVFMKKDNNSSLFNGVKIIGMPKGYGIFLNSLIFELPDDDVEINDWKFQIGVNESASNIDFNDSSWELRKSGNGWRDEMQHAWYRKEINLPDEINGLKVNNNIVRILADLNDKGEIWINGKFKQKFRSGDGNVVISNTASTDSTYLIAIKVVNEWGTGDVRSAKLVTNKAYKIREIYSELKTKLATIISYCDKSPFPNIDVINKLTSVIEENKNSISMKSASRIIYVLNSIEAKLASQPTFSIFPYLQNLREDKLTIMWKTVFPTYGKVLYGKNGKCNIVVDEKKTAKTMHELTLKNLEPNTRYSYKVVCGNTSSPIQNFTTNKASITPYKYVVLGDTRSRHDIHTKIVKKVLKEKPLFVINTGDMVSDGKEIDDWNRFFKINQKLISSTPYFPVLGNHERSSEHYYNLFSLPNNEKYYSFKMGDALFVVLDSEGEELSDLNYVTGESGDEFWWKNYKDYFAQQKKWLEDELEKHKNVGFIYAFHHKPLYSVMKRRTPEVNRSRRIWGDIFEKYNVQVFFNGHDHHYHHAVKNEVHYITTAGGGARLYIMDDPLPETKVLSKIEHYVVVNQNDKNAEISVIDVNGNEIDKLVVQKRKLNN